MFEHVTFGLILPNYNNQGFQPSVQAHRLCIDILKHFLYHPFNVLYLNWQTTFGYNCPVFGLEWH